MKNKRENINFSVLMSVYYKERPEFLSESLKSIFSQSFQATEVILIEDGKLTVELDRVIEKYSKKYSNLKVYKLPENKGLGEALNIGLNYCNYEYIMRADSDDICVKERFEKQLDYMIKHPEIDVLGTDIFEFKEDINEEDLRLKHMPTGSSINSYIKQRNPLNHMTVCFKKSSVRKAGNYMPMQYLEDYYLWIRMFNCGMKLENLSEPLVYARIGNGFEKRRGSKKQIAGWKKLQKFMFDAKIIDKKRRYVNIINMYLLVYMPNSVRKIVYKVFLRG